ncbi:MAG: DUF1868 domain-containing protein [Pseudomonadota bacterium]
MPYAASPPRPPLQVDPIDYLTGRWEEAEVPSGVRSPRPKFTSDGHARPWPGVTIVAHVAPDSDTFAALVAMQDALKAQPFAHRFTYLPPTSFHMTVFDGANETTRGTPAWPRGVAADADWAAVSDTFEERLSGLTLPQLLPASHSLFAGFSLVLTGADAAAEAVLRSTRDRLREATEVVKADHATYVFHVTLAYLLTYVGEAEARDIVTASDALYAEHAPRLDPLPLGPVELCDFTDMHAFHPRLRL